MSGEEGRAGKRRPCVVGVEVTPGMWMVGFEIREEAAAARVSVGLEAKDL